MNFTLRLLVTALVAATAAGQISAAQTLTFKSVASKPGMIWLNIQGGKMIALPRLAPGQTLNVVRGNKKFTIDGKEAKSSGTAYLEAKDNILSIKAVVGSLNETITKFKGDPIGNGYLAADSGKNWAFEMNEKDGLASAG